MTDEPKKIVCNEENRRSPFAELRCTSHVADAMHTAVYENDAATFDYLVKHNVDLNCLNIFGETPLLMGIRRTGSPALFERLLALGCDINITDAYGQTPLHVAILNGNVQIAQKLIELGAVVDVQYLHTRETPLFYAIKNNDIEAVCMLLCYGADVTIKNAENYTPLTYAMNNYRQDIILILLDYCDDFNYTDNDGYTPLHLVIGYESDLVIRLIDAGADVNCITKYGSCALELAMKVNAEVDVFKKIWGQMNVDVMLETEFPLLLTYIESVWHYSANEWVEYLYLMLESPIAIVLIDRCTVFSFITALLYSVQIRNVTSRDRQNIINICLTLGAEVTVTDLDAAIQLFGHKEELTTLIYATEYYRNEDIHHPLLPLIIGLSDFNFPKVIWWCRKYIKARLSEEAELVNNIIVSCLGFFSLTPFWKQELLQDCQWSSRSEYEWMRKMCKAEKSYQFHDAVKSLPLPGAVINLLLFKRPIYK